MGVTLPKDIRIAGFLIGRVKKALQAIGRSGRPTSITDSRTIANNRLDGAILYEECLDRGLIDLDPAKTGDDRHEDDSPSFLTEGGLAIAGGKATRRTPLAKAQEILDAFLDRVDQLAADPDAPSHAHQIWLFGSMLRGEETVGDIDIAYTTGFNPKYTHEERRKVERARLIAADGPYDLRQYDFGDWLIRRAIFGPRRHHLLAGAQHGTYDLESLGVECRLIYDRSRGGRVDDPIRDKHPQSEGRDTRMDAPRTMPNLDPLHWRPMDANWLSGYGPAGHIHPYHIHGDHDRVPHVLRPCGYETSVISRPDQLQLVHGIGGWVPKAVERDDADGRERCVLVSGSRLTDNHFAITLDRRVVVEDGTVTIKATLLDVENRYRYHDHDEACDALAPVALLLAADAEKCRRRIEDLGLDKRVVIEIAEAEVIPDVNYGECLLRLVEEDMDLHPVIEAHQKFDHDFDDDPTTMPSLNSGG